MKSTLARRCAVERISAAKPAHTSHLRGADHSPAGSALSPVVLTFSFGTIPGRDQRCWTMQSNRRAGPLCRPVPALVWKRHTNGQGPQPYTELNSFLDDLPGLTLRSCQVR